MAASPITPVRSLQEALRQVEEFQGEPSQFVLAFPDDLDDPIGINMAVLTDKILDRGWMPNGFIQKSGFKLYKYKPADGA